MSVTQRVINRYARCGAAFRHWRDDGERYCTKQCRAWALRERYSQQRARLRSIERQRQYERLASAPVHELHPGMLLVMEHVARQRPSWARWYSQRHPLEVNA